MFEAEDNGKIMRKGIVKKRRDNEKGFWKGLEEFEKKLKDD
uniref:Saliva protein-3 n=1 Tax=Tetranychus truncatus TaxID=93132 RepID=A0A3G5ANW4_9ACAR|nr:saliva protein-3 [Tetranychus truncatus]